MSNHDSLKREVIKYLELIEKSLKSKMLTEVFSEDDAAFLIAVVSTMRTLIDKCGDRVNSLMIAFQILSIIDFIIASALMYGSEYASKLINLLSRTVQPY